MKLFMNITTIPANFLSELLGFVVGGKRLQVCFTVSQFKIAHS